MKIIFAISIALLVGCEMKKSAEVTYMETNAALVDTIRLLYLANDEDIEALEDIVIEQGVTSIRNLNYQLDQVKNAIISDSDQAIDKRAVKKFLSDGRAMEILRNLASGCETLIGDHLDGLEVQPSITTISRSDNSIPLNFEGMPLYEVVPILNRWILENERVIEQILNQ